MQYKKTKYNIFAPIVVITIFCCSTIDVGGDGRSYNITIGDEIVCAYSNGRDITEDYKNSEEKAKTAIIEYYENHDVEFLDFCHLGDTLNLTVDIMVDGEKCYTVAWEDDKISGTHELEKEYAEQWYKLK